METPTKVGKIKQHFKDHNELYIGFGIGACMVFAAAGGAKVLRKGGGESSSKLIEIVQIGFRPKATATVIQLVERSTASKPVHLVGTNLYFNSLNEAARETGHSLTKISRHVNGHIPDLNGDVFELLEPAH